MTAFITLHFTPQGNLRLPPLDLDTTSTFKTQGRVCLLESVACAPGRSSGFKDACFKRPLHGFQNFSTFDMDKLGKIRQIRWKERL